MIVPATSPPDYPIFRLCTRTLASASRLVPASRRFEWRQEWEAEVWHHLQSLIEAGRLTRERQLDLFLRCLGAIRHAAWLRGRSATHRARMSLHELAGEPAWACMLILTLGLTLGTAATVFDLGWAALTQSSPDSMNDRVVRVWNRAEAAELGRGAVSAGEFVRFERANSTLEHIAAFRRRAMVIDDGTSGMLARGAFVTSDFFAVFGLRLSGAAGGRCQ